MEVKITTCGHACFVLEANGYRTVIDPYAWGMIPGMPDLHLTANAVCCSHQHDDHNFVKAVTLVQSTEAAPYTVAEYTVPHDDANGTKRGMSTVRVFDFDGLKVAHMGDIGVFPREELLDALKGVDCLLIPVGGFYTIDSPTAKAIIDAVQPRVAIPMHYRTDTTGFKVISHIDDFTKLCGSVKTAENTVVLTGDTETQILVLNYKF